MDDRSLLVLKHMVGIVAALAGILAALFEFRDRAQTDEERARTRAIYGRKWATIKDSGLLELPERVIAWILKVAHVLSKNAFDKIYDIIPTNLEYLFVFVGIPLYVAIAGWLRFGWVGLFVMGAPLTVLIVIFILNDRGTFLVLSMFDTPIKLAFVAFVVAGTVMWLDIALGFRIAYALAFMLALLPVLLLFLGLSMGIVGDAVDDVPRLKVDPDKWAFVGMAIAASFPITLLSLLLGSLALPTSWIPQTIQMLASNVVCDGLTMYTTLIILSLAVRQERPLSIPIAVLLDITVGALLACASLYFGLVFTDHAVSIGQVFRVLVGFSPVGDHFEIGPYFWAMHTSFIPTLCYLSLIVFCWLGKLIILPIASILSKGRAVEKPHHLTAGALLFLFAFFAALAKALDLIHDLAQNQTVSP